MSATYNWAYKPGVPNKYGIVINSSADNVAPSNAYYIALFGNDVTGNGSRQYPFRTLAYLNTLVGGYTSNYVIMSSGVYREKLYQYNIIGDGDVVFDLFLNLGLGSGPDGHLINVKIRNLQTPIPDVTQIVNYQDSQVLGDGFAYPHFYPDTTFYNNLIGNFSAMDLVISGSLSPTNGFNTYVNIGNFRMNAIDIYHQGALNFSIYYNVNFSFESEPNFDYCLFYNCTFRMGSSGSFTSITDVATLQALVRTVYPLNQAFNHSIFADPQFNNPSIGDYTLSFSSPAKNASYFGTPIGCNSVGYSLKARAVEADGGFDFSTNVNLNIADDSITIVDTSQIASIETKVIVNSIGRELSNLPTFGFNADRNGQYIDSIPDLSGLTVSAGATALSMNTPYFVGVGDIQYSGNVYLPGDRFTTGSTDTGFTTTSSGVVFEILEAPERHTVMARFSNGDGFIYSGATVTPGYIYFVDGATMSYNGLTYSVGSTFKAVNSGTVSGGGTLIIAMSTESYQHYEIGIKPYSNNVGDVRTGAIIRGNGDPNYVRGGINVTEFPINSKFIQIKYILQISNLTP